MGLQPRRSFVELQILPLVETKELILNGFPLFGREERIVQKTEKASPCFTGPIRPLFLSEIPVGQRSDHIRYFSMKE
jgi:hypothetical protein